jgi:hypothetical protein
MRTISFNIDGADATDTIAHMLVSLPAGRPGNSIKFDRDGSRFTVAWRLLSGDWHWAVSFRPASDFPDGLRYYRNPVDAARAIIDQKHNESGTKGIIPPGV